MDVKHIKRRLLDPLMAHMSEKEISLIIGPRQAGKTTLMEELREGLVKKGEKTLFLSLDFDAQKKWFMSQEALLSHLDTVFGGQKGFVFIDEIQRKTNAGLFLKGLYDRQTPYKFIVSGSGSVELKEKVHESLAGRKLVFELGTVSFEEFADFRTEYQYAGRLHDFFTLDASATNRLLDEYLAFGGYPRVVLSDTSLSKTKIINDIYQSYVEKDIAFLLRVEKLDTFGDMLRLLSAQVGGIMNYSDIAQALDISVSTLKNYLWYAEKTYIAERMPPYFRNARKEITKSPVMYFHDLGLRNYMAGSFGALRDAREKGFVFQNFVRRELVDAVRFRNIAIRFWRTKDKAEVDFVLESARDSIPVEVKYTDLKQGEIERSLRSFIEKYSPPSACVVNRSYEGVKRVGNTEVHFLPFWKISTILDFFR